MGGAPITGVGISGCGTMLATAGGSNFKKKSEHTDSTSAMITVWSLQLLRQYCMMLPDGHHKPCASVVVHPENGKYASAGSRDVRVWSRGTWHCWRTLSWCPSDKNQSIHVTLVRYTANGKLLASVYCKDGAPDTIVLWDTQTEQNVNELVCTEDTVGHHITDMAFAPDGLSLAMTFSDGGCKMWRLGERDKLLPGHLETATCITFSGDGEMLATGSTDKTVKIHEIRKGTGRIVLKGHSGAEDGSCILWDVALSCIKHTIWPLNVRAVTAIGFNPVDGKLLALGLRPRRSSGRKSALEMWTLKENKEEPDLFTEIRGHEDPIASLQYGHDGTYIVTSSGKYVYTTCSNETAREDKYWESQALKEIEDKENALREADAAAKASEEARLAAIEAEKAAQDARVAQEAVREAIEDENHVEMVKIVNAARAAAEAHWAKSEVAVTRGKLDLDTKMVIFATAEEDYIAIVEKNMELYAKLDFLGQQAEDMLEEAIEKERVASDFPSKEATKEAKRTRELHLGKVEEHEKCAKDVERAQNKAANAKQRKEKLFYEAESAKEAHNHAMRESVRAQNALTSLEKKLANLEAAEAAEGEAAREAEEAEIARQNLESEQADVAEAEEKLEMEKQEIEDAEQMLIAARVAVENAESGDEEARARAGLKHAKEELEREKLEADAAEEHLRQEQEEADVAKIKLEKELSEAAEAASEAAAVHVHNQANEANALEEKRKQLEKEAIE